MLEGSNPGFWTRKDTEDSLRAFLKTQRISLTHGDSAWDELRRWISRLTRKGNARATKKLEELTSERHRIRMPILMEELEFESPLSQFIGAFATQLTRFDRLMRKKHGPTYVRRARPFISKPLSRAFLGVYRDLDFSSPQHVMQGLSDIQAHGVQCPTPGGVKTRLYRLEDYGVEKLTELTNEIERSLVASRAGRRRKSSAAPAEPVQKTQIALDLVERCMVRVSCNGTTYTLKHQEASFLRTLWFAKADKQPYASYDELEKQLANSSRKSRPRKTPDNPNNKWSVLRRALHKRFQTELKVPMRPKHPLVETVKNKGYRLNDTDFIWKEFKDRSDQRQHLVKKKLHEGYRGPGSSKRSGRTGDAIQ